MFVRETHVLELGTNARADTHGVTLGVGSTAGAASLGAVVVGDATSGGELLALAVANITSSGVVGSEGDGADRDLK